MPPAPICSAPSPIVSRHYQNTRASFFLSFIQGPSKRACDLKRPDVPALSDDLAAGRRSIWRNASPDRSARDVGKFCDPARVELVCGRLPGVAACALTPGYRLATLQV